MDWCLLAWRRAEGRYMRMIQRFQLSIRCLTPSIVPMPMHASALPTNQPTHTHTQTGGRRAPPQTRATGRHPARAGVGGGGPDLAAGGWGGGPGDAHPELPRGDHGGVRGLWCIISEDRILALGSVALTDRHSSLGTQLGTQGFLLT